MNIEQAYELIGSKSSESLERIEQRFHDEKNLWNGKLSASLLPKHVEQCRTRLRDLDAAMECILASRPKTEVPIQSVPGSAAPIEGVGVGRWIQEESKRSLDPQPTVPNAPQGDEGKSPGSKFWNWTTLGGRVKEEYRWLPPSVAISILLMGGLGIYSIFGSKTDDDAKDQNSSTIGVSVTAGDQQELDAEMKKVADLFSNGEVEKAADSLKEALEKYPSNPRPVEYLEKLLNERLAEISDQFAKGEVEKSTKALKAWLERFPEDPLLVAHREKMYQSIRSEALEQVKLGNNPGAITNYQFLLALNPDHTLSGTVLEELNKLLVPQGRIHVSTGDVPSTVTLLRYASNDKKPQTLLEKSSPAEFVDLPYGTYGLIVSADGFEKEEGTIQITSGQLRDNTLKLRRSLGDLKVTANLERAKFKLKLVEGSAKLKEAEKVEKDGIVPGELNDLPTGKYEISFPEYGVSQEVVVEAGPVKELSVLLKSSPKSDNLDTIVNSNNSELGGLAEGLEVSTDRTAYRDGDAVRISVRIPRDGFLRVYSIDAEKAVHQVFPNEFESENRVRTGELRTIPGNGSYRLALSLPAAHEAGREKVFAVFSDTQFTDNQLRDFENGSFPSLGQAGNGFSVSKGLSAQAITTALAGMASYDVSR